MNKSILTAENIIELRNKMNLTREALAQMLGVSGKTVARWENQKNNEPPTGTAAIVLSNLVSNVLDIPLPEGKPELIAEMENINEKNRIKENPDTIFMLLDQAKKEEKDEICLALKIPTDSDIFNISKEYRSAAGHTIGNWFRGPHDMPYKEVLVDVANKLKSKGSGEVFALGDGRSEEEVEDKIILYFAEKIAAELSKMRPDERAKKFEELKEKLADGKNLNLDKESLDNIKNAFALGSAVVGTSAVSSLLTGSVTASLFYSGAFATLWGGVFGMSSSLLLLTGTGVGAAIAAPLLLIILGSPSYKKIIPVTLQLINIRRRVKEEMS